MNEKFLNCESATELRKMYTEKEDFSRIQSLIKQADKLPSGYEDIPNELKNDKSYLDAYNRLKKVIKKGDIIIYNSRGGVSLFNKNITNWVGPIYKKYHIVYKESISTGTKDVINPSEFKTLEKQMRSMKNGDTFLIQGTNDAKPKKVVVVYTTVEGDEHNSRKGEVVRLGILPKRFNNRPGVLGGSLQLDYKNNEVIYQSTMTQPTQKVINIKF